MKTIITAAAGMILSIFSTTIQAATFTVDKSKSHITVSARSTGGNFKGHLTKYNATISGNADTLEPSSAKITWKFADLDTKKASRNKKMLKWLDVGKHPSGSFALIRVFEKQINNKPHAYALGTITIHGVSKKITFPIKTLRNGQSLTISGQAALNTKKDFKLPIIRTAIIATVKPELTVDFSLTGTIK